MQITRTTPLRRMILQLRHIFFTEAATFMVFSLTPIRSLLRAEHNLGATQILRREPEGNLDPGVTQKHMSAFRFYSEGGIREVFDNFPVHLDDFIPDHLSSS